MRKRILIIVAAVGVAVFAVGGGAAGYLLFVDQDDTGQVVSQPVTDPATTPVPTFTAPASLGPCDQLAGTPTMDVVNVSLCDDSNGQQILASFSYECPDGRSLYWNDFGWGYSDGNWQEHNRSDGQLVPPDAEMSNCQ